MAVAAVPGAGKSHSLAVAAAIAIAQHQLHHQKQLLIVTYTRSAAAAIKSKVRQRLQQLALPGLGFTVQTLHGIALNIALRHPEVSGLDLNNQAIVSPHRSHRLVKTVVEQWRRQNPQAYQEFLAAGHFDGETTESLRRQSALGTEILPALTKTVVSEAKSSGLTPQAVASLSQIPPGSLSLAAGAELFSLYQQGMARKGWVDYDDMILAALNVLDDPNLCQQWQHQYFGVFEDEAQDSSPLQERLLTRLAQDPASGTVRLIRVGDPNQAINSTFTPADPLYFNWFCQRCQETAQFATMDQAGRSNATVMAVANYLIQWVNQHWQSRCGEAAATLSLPFRAQAIRPVDPGDRQPNPPATDGGVDIQFPPDIYQEVEHIKQRLVPLLEANPDHTAAILVRENSQGTFIADRLR
ncbi:MAG: hypothetical protein RLZZ568_1486, partial [Cyanobacteriota bacterium]